MNQMLRPLNGAGDELWVEHDVQSVNAEATLCGLPATIDFYRVAHRLEGVKGQADGQGNGQNRQGKIHVQTMRAFGQGATDKVVIFEYREHANVRDKAHKKKHFAPLAFRFLNQNSREVVGDDSEDQDEKIDRDESQVENAARDQQVKPSESLGQEKVENRDDREKKAEL